MYRNKFIYLLLPVIFFLIIAGCSKDVDSGESGVPIVFAANDVFTAETKVDAVTTSNLTSIYVTATRGAMGTSSEQSFWTSVNFTKNAGVFSANKFWPASDPGLHFYGSSAPMAFSSNACSVSVNTSSDVVCAVLPSPSYAQQNAFVFQHIFARLGMVTVNAPAGFSVSGVSVKVTPRTSGTYNLLAGNGFTDGTGWSGVTNGLETTLSTSNDLYLIPGSYDFTVIYTLSKGDWTHSFTKVANASVIAGSVNNITMTVPSEQVSEIVISISLSSWGVQNHTPEFS